MAKDGSLRGGARMGSGPKKRALTDKIKEGKSAGVIVLPEGTDLAGNDMPAPKEYMMEKQRNGSKFCAEEIYKETWMWLRERGCEKVVSTQLIEQYAMSVSRWIQCEQAISEFGFLAKHPTTNQAIASPYVSMSQNYMKQVNQLWYQIFQVVKENCSSEWQGATPQDDVMERLLRSREKR